MNCINCTWNSSIISLNLLCCSKNYNKKPLKICCSISSVAVEQSRLLLHESLASAGIDTTHAKTARQGFSDQIRRLSAIDGETSIAISRGTDLGRAALLIAAEDDSLISHSSVPLPVDAFVERLDDLSMGFCPLYLPPSRSSPEVFFSNLERYFYVHKGFHRAEETIDVRGLYLHSALTCRSGSAAVLSLIYSEMLKLLRMYGVLDFDAEIYFPHDLITLPKGYPKLKCKLSDEPHIMTAKSLLIYMLANLKRVFWPFQYGNSGSLFLKAAHAATNILSEPSFARESYSKPTSSISGQEIAATRASQHRVGRGIGAGACLGDMRCALAACERLILLQAGYEEYRDYAILLYHCRHYAECLDFLKLYQSSRDSDLGEGGRAEQDTVQKLIGRVKLILDEQGWSKTASKRNYWDNSLEPW